MLFLGVAGDDVDNTDTSRTIATTAVVLASKCWEPLRSALVDVGTCGAGGDSQQSGSYGGRSWRSSILERLSTFDEYCRIVV